MKPIELARVIEGQLKMMEEMRRASESIGDNLDALTSVEASFKELYTIFFACENTTIRELVALRMYVMEKNLSEERDFQKLVKDFNIEFTFENPVVKGKKKRRGGSADLPLSGGFSLPVVCYT